MQTWTSLKSLLYDESRLVRGGVFTEFVATAMCLRCVAIYGKRPHHLTSDGRHPRATPRDLLSARLRSRETPAPPGAHYRRMPSLFLSLSLDPPPPHPFLPLLQGIQSRLRRLPARGSSAASGACPDTGSNPRGRGRGRGRGREENKDSQTGVCVCVCV